MRLKVERKARAPESRMFDIATDDFRNPCASHEERGFWSCGSVQIISKGVKKPEWFEGFRSEGSACQSICKPGYRYSKRVRIEPNPDGMAKIE